MQRIVVAVAIMTLAWGVPGTPAGAAEATINMVGTQYVPQWTRASADSKVTWVNTEADNYPTVMGSHNIIPDEVAGALPGNQPFPTSSPLINVGETWSCDAGAHGVVCTGINGKQVELTPGRYAYMCGLHPNQMHAVLEVF